MIFPSLDFEEQMVLMAGCLIALVFSLSVLIRREADLEDHPNPKRTGRGAGDNEEGD